MDYGVIGNTADSGSAILGSSPGRPAFSLYKSEENPNLVTVLGS